MVDTLGARAREIYRVCAHIANARAGFFGAGASGAKVGGEICRRSY
jgi:hypothetical protein